MAALVARIDLAALQANFKTAQSLAPASRIFAVIKADAYGHGSVACANALGESDGFAVATLEEAVQLRQQNIEKPILVLSRFCQPEDVNVVQQFDLLPVVHNTYQLDLLINNHNGRQPINCWLKVDTGMNRLGLDPTMLNTVLETTQATAGINVVGLMSHFACADETDNEFTSLQLTRFNLLTDRISMPLSIANSAAIMAWPDTHKHWNRPGIMLYGASPLNISKMSANKVDHITLQPVMSLISRLISTARLKRGEGIGYGQTFIATKDMQVGIVACGYADGYPRHAGTGTPVLVCNKRCRLLGRVSMDTLAVDLTEAPQADVGSPVELWGSNLPVNEIAMYAGSIAYELLTGVSKRVPRQYIN